MLKFKLKMNGYYIVVPDYVYNWKLLEVYIYQYNITNIRLVIASYKETFAYSGGEVHNVECFYSQLFGYEITLVLIRHEEMYDYYILTDDLVNVDAISNEESFIRSLLNETYKDEPYDDSDIINKRQNALKLFTHNLILGDRNALR